MKLSRLFGPIFYCININSVEDYFNLPKSEREHFGLYKIPRALPWEIFDKEMQGWDLFYSKIKKEYPIQYFFRKYLFSFDNPLVLLYCRYIYWPLRDLWYASKLWFDPVHPRWRNVLPRHEHQDITSLVVESNFALIRDFYWEEVVDGIVDWNGTENHKTFYNELVLAVNWIEKEREEIDKQISKALKDASNNPVKINNKFDYTATYGKLNELEELKTKKETEILNWFILNRSYFWT